ncbi:hypothetical protein AAHC03_019474 [Spirometra sp. Aus1]
MKRLGQRLLCTQRSKTIIKVVYILCAATLTTSIIVGAILIHLLVLPFLHESGFEPSTCYIAKTELHMPVLKCENKCSKERSAFPCLRVTILYEKGGQNKTGLLFDTIATHQNYRRNGCVTSSCHQRWEENIFFVDMFKADLQRRGKFNCFISAEHDDEALMFKFYRPTTIFYALFWPAFTFSVSLFTVLAIYAVDRCRVWQSDALWIG